MSVRITGCSPSPCLSFPPSFFLSLSPSLCPPLSPHLDTSTRFSLLCAGSNKGQICEKVVSNVLQKEKKKEKIYIITCLPLSAHPTPVSLSLSFSLFLSLSPPLPLFFQAMLPMRENNTLSRLNSSRNISNSTQSRPSLLSCVKKANSVN